MTEIEVDRLVLKLALKRMSMVLDELIGECLSGGPDKGTIARLRAYLPPYCENAYR